MKQEQRLVLLVSIAIIATYFLFFKKDKNQVMDEKKEFTPEDAESALLTMAGKYNKERAQLLERILRHETNHFKSGQYKKGGSAGMEDGKWFDLPKGSYTTYKMRDNLQGYIATFIKWNSVLSFLEYLNKYIDRYNGNYARWNSLDATRQAEYRNRVNAVKNRTIV
jgi:hypothetical protein